jgi:glycopeptide antibiotics resistance protein
VQVVHDPPRAVAQMGGNLLVFAAVGALGPMRWPALAGLGRLLVGGAVASLVVETTQYALDIGRVWSVDDVLLNAAGAALGGALTRRWWARPPARATGEVGRPVAG